MTRNRADETHYCPSQGYTTACGIVAGSVAQYRTTTGSVRHPVRSTGRVANVTCPDCRRRVAPQSRSPETVAFLEKLVAYAKATGTAVS